MFVWVCAPGRTGGSSPRRQSAGCDALCASNIWAHAVTHERRIRMVNERGLLSPCAQRMSACKPASIWRAGGAVGGGGRGAAPLTYERGASDSDGGRRQRACRRRLGSGARSACCGKPSRLDLGTRSPAARRAATTACSSGCAAAAARQGGPALVSRLSSDAAPG